MNQTINNYEILPTSSFFNFSDILTIGTIIAAFITLYITIRNNNKTLEKTLEYETNRRKIIEFNEIAVSVKTVEYELKRLYKVLIIETPTDNIFQTENLLELINSMSDKVFYMESQFDLKSYNKVIHIIYGNIDKNKKEELNKKLYLLYINCAKKDSDKPTKENPGGLETAQIIKGIKKEASHIAKKELNMYLDDILIAKKALVDAIAEINTTDFN